MWARFVLVVLSMICVVIARTEETKNIEVMREARRGKRPKCNPRRFSLPEKGPTAPTHAFGGHIAIANREGGTFSLVNPKTLRPAVTYVLEDEGEPMYFAFAQDKSELWVGDRANNRLVILRMEGCNLVPDGYISTPAGLFHSMITQTAEKYPIALTTCDIDLVTVAHDLTTRRLLGTMYPPEEATKAGAKPHDVTTNGPYAFVTYLGTSDGAGYVASYHTSDFSLIEVLETAADPHVAVRDDTAPSIAAQGGEVLTVSVPDLKIIAKSTDQPSPHGMFISFDNRFLYITNISEGGENAVVVFDPKTGEKLDCPPIATKFPVPHNPAANLDGSKVYITHSGATSKMNSVFSVRHDGCLKPGSERTFETDFNPFGLFVLPPAPENLKCA